MKKFNSSLPLNLAIFGALFCVSMNAFAIVTTPGELENKIHQSIMKINTTLAKTNEIKIAWIKNLRVAREQLITEAGPKAAEAKKLIDQMIVETEHYGDAEWTKIEAAIRSDARAIEDFRSTAYSAVQLTLDQITTKLQQLETVAKSEEEAAAAEAECDKEAAQVYAKAVIAHIGVGAHSAAKIISTTAASYVAAATPYVTAAEGAVMQGATQASALASAAAEKAEDAAAKVEAAASAAVAKAEFEAAKAEAAVGAVAAQVAANPTVQSATAQAQTVATEVSATVGAGLDVANSLYIETAFAIEGYLIDVAKAHPSVIHAIMGAWSHFAPEADAIASVPAPIAGAGI